MRDWLGALERIGHQTHLAIESGNHELLNSLSLAKTCAEFHPDLIVVIDHYRTELGGLPDGIPVMMWVQDALPNMFRREAGNAQGKLDYAMGFARLRMIHEFNYPADRYMPAVVGVNEQRFATRDLSPGEISEFGCDASFVSHASTPADAMIKEEIRKINSPEGGRLISDIFDQLRAVYELGGIVCEPIEIRRMIERGTQNTHTSLPAGEIPKWMELFCQRINNALFRHQSLQWLAEMGIDLRIYGRGWENHPTLGKFARGIADNHTQLPLIYQASKISLHISPHGAVHQRVIEGLACGGFFLLAHCPGDLLEREFQKLWKFCLAHNITTDAQLRRQAKQETITAIAKILHYDPFAAEYPLVEVLRDCAEAGYLRSAGTVWGDAYDSVRFQSAIELRAKVTHFLADPEHRCQVAQGMRQTVLERFTYLATARRVLKFIADDLAGAERQRVAA
jgi:hypothetical protein